RLTMSTQRFVLTGLLILALLAPGAAASTAQPIAPQTLDTSKAPTGSMLFAENSARAPEEPDNFPWQANQSVYAYLPDCADQDFPDIAIDAAQNLYALWSDQRNGVPDIYFAYRPPVGAWSANVRVNDVPGTLQGAPRIVADAAGNAYAVWNDTRNGDPDIYFAYRPAGGAWSANRKVNSDAGTTTQKQPDIGIDASGNVFITWSDNRNGDWDIYANSGTAFDPWNPETRVNDDDTNAEQSEPHIAVDSTGNAQLIWFDYRDGTRDVYSSQRTGVGSWSVNEVLVNSYDDPYSGPHPQDICLAVNAAGVSWFAHGGYYCYGPCDEYYVTADAWWELRDNNYGSIYLSDVSVDSTGAALIATTKRSTWYGWAPSYVEVYHCQPGASSCPSVGFGAAYGADALNPSLALGASGSAHVAWADGRYRNRDIFFYSLAGTGVSMVNDDVCSSPDQLKPDIAVDAAGNAYAVWEDQRSGDAGIYFAYRSAGGSWEAPVRMQEAGIHGDRFSPAIAVDPAGNAYAVWSDMRNGTADIYFARRPTGGTWGASEQVPGSETLWDLWDRSPDITVDTHGNVYVAWDGLEPAFVDNYLLFNQRTPSGTWSEAEDLGVNSDFDILPAIASDRAGNILLLYLDYALRSRYRSAEGTWGSVQSLPSSVYSNDFDIAIDQERNAYAVWTAVSGSYPYRDFYVRSAHRPADGAWRSPETVYELLDTDLGEGTVSVAIDDAGNVYTTWGYQGELTTDVYSAYRPAAGAWGPAVRINDDTGGANQWRSTIAVDPAGNAHAL
ncbi:MAG: hypothetical protein KDH90_22460, partial [Anaerolineae bacterium]|nr:hypothetical protein [Anaerolineae bacterium]